MLLPVPGTRTMLHAPIEISWLAVTCNLDGADIYLGLTAGMDDVVAHAMSASQMVAFPFQHIRITAGGDAESMPLRVYAVRDASIVRVVTQPGPPPLEGFHRVRLDFHMSRAEHTEEHASTAAEAKAPTGVAEPPPSHPVMAFLLTIGLPREREDEFYGTVVNEFLQRSWMTLPRLLREIGCSTPSEIAAGTSSACPT